VKEWKPSRTAQAVAAERALLGDLGVLDDPHARSMLEPAMRRAHAALRRLPRRTWSRSVTLAGLAGRVRWFDREVVDAIGSGVGQVVTVGAGYDSRPWRFHTDGVVFFEVDHPATQADKRRRAPGPGPVFVASDLIDDDVATELIRAGLDRSRPTVFVVEGVTMYLEEPVVRRQLAAFAALASTPGSRLAIDFYPSRRPDVGVQRRQLLLQRVARVGSGEGFRLGVDRDDAARLVADAGWDVTAVVSAREAATALVGADCGLPTTRVSADKTFVAAGSR
jgi:methyltransferase (TIGR00027 family)